jgi:uncharacterized protein YcfL
MKKMTVLFIALLLIVACISIVSAEEDVPFFYGAFATEIE